MGTGSAEVALTAHLVMPDAPADDAFVGHATGELRRRFRIAHATLQATRRPVMEGCGEQQRC